MPCAIRVLATDYDGTIADRGVMDEAAGRALDRLRAAGVRTVLVTGREWPELQKVCRRLDRFDRVVAENGGLLVDPTVDLVHPLAPPPPEVLVDALRARRVAPLRVGRVVVATWRPHERACTEIIAARGLDYRVILNKRAVMLLPAGVDKASGLEAALRDLGCSWPETLGVGDAENDLDFLARCGVSAAVANALPAVQARVHLVTAGVRGAGVAELIGRVFGVSGPG